MAKAMILAAGFGTRLRPLTEELPKPLLPLGDKPVLAHVAERLERAGLEAALVNAHHHREKISAFANGCPFIVHVEHEPEIRGTAGGVSGVRGLLGQPPVIVTNADLVLDPPIEPLLAGAATLGMAMAVKLRPSGEGRVGVAADGTLARLRDERFGAEVHGADYLSVCALGAPLLDRLPARGCLVGDVALPWLREGQRIAAVPVSVEFYSVGDSIADYLDAQLRWLALHEAFQYVGPGSSIAPGVVLEHSVVGAGARITGAGRVERCVVWPGAEARAPLRDAVVTTAGVVVGRDVV